MAKIPANPRFRPPPGGESARRRPGQPPRRTGRGTRRGGSCAPETAPMRGGPGEKPEIAEDRDGRERRAAAALAAKPAGQAKERRRRESQPRAGDRRSPSSATTHAVPWRAHDPADRCEIPANTMRAATDGPSTFCASRRPVAIAPAKIPGPRPLTAGPESNVRSRKSALQPRARSRRGMRAPRTPPTTSSGRSTAHAAEPARAARRDEVREDRRCDRAGDSSSAFSAVASAPVCCGEPVRLQPGSSAGSRLRDRRDGVLESPSGDAARARSAAQAGRASAARRRRSSSPSRSSWRTDSKAGARSSSSGRSSRALRSAASGLVLRRRDGRGAPVGTEVGWPVGRRTHAFCGPPRRPDLCARRGRGPCRRCARRLRDRRRGPRRCRLRPCSAWPGGSGARAGGAPRSRPSRSSATWASSPARHSSGRSPEHTSLRGGFLFLCAVAVILAACAPILRRVVVKAAVSRDFTKKVAISSGFW